MSERPWAIGYSRVSTTRQAIEGESLALQAELIRKEIVSQGWRLVPEAHVLQEPFTGTTQDRPVYKEALRIIKSNPGKVGYFVVRSIDRFTREGSLQYQQMKAELANLNVELRDIGRVIQPTINTLEHLGVSYKWSRATPSAISEVVLAEAGRHEVSSILTRLIGTEIALVRNGYHIGPADDGYVVKRISVEGKKRCAQFADPERAHFFQTIFSMRADGATSDKEIVEYLNALGFRSKPRNIWDDTKTKLVGRRAGKPLTVKQLQKIILRPVYCGVIAEKWTNWQPVRAQGGQPLVSLHTYNEANRGKRFIEESGDGTLRMSYDRQSIPLIRKRQRFSDRWPYKNVAMCPKCRLPLWASASRGKSGKHFPAYHCTRGHERYSVPQKTLDAAFAAFLDKLRFVDEAWNEFTDSVRAVYCKEVAETEEQVTRSKQTVAQLEEHKNQMAESFALATTNAMRASIEQKVQAIDTDIAALRATSAGLDVKESDVDEFLIYTRRLLEHPARILESVRNRAEQLALYSLVFEEFPSLEQVVSGTPKLTATFRVFPGFGDPEGHLVHNKSLNWNTVHQEMSRWQKGYWAIELVRTRLNIG